MKRKLLTTVLIGTLFSATSLSVSAAGVPVGSNPVMSTVPSEFTADESQVGGGASILLPATLDLTYDNKLDSFSNNSKIKCSGSIAGSDVIAVGLGEITYTGDNTTKELKAYAKLDGKELASFTATDVENETEKDLLVQVPASTVKAADTFRGTVNFNISLAPLGMYSSITTDTAPSDFTVDKNSFYGGTAYHPLYFITNSTSKSSINFDSLKSLSKVEFVCTTPENVTETLNNTSITSIELTANNCMGYASWFNTSDKWLGIHASGDFSGYKHHGDLYSYNIRGCFKGLTNLHTIVVPSNISKEQLRCFMFKQTYINVTPGFLDSDYYKYNLIDKDTPIGDATVFVKDIDSNNNWIYVPNIVYRGTMSEWKALSANGEDWVFGNAANIVTVHCTDGKLFY